MVFSSVEFLFLFLPAFLLAQALLPVRNLTFVCFSVLFYFVGEGWYTAIVLFSALMNYAFGLSIDAATDRQSRKAMVTLAIAANLALLVFFKYAGFVSENIAGANKDAWLQSIHLPLGISFFTFHAMSYLIDVYRGDAKAERSLTNLALYILMFPQLIAGPILRFSAIAQQLHIRKVTALHLYYGAFYFCVGLGQKTLIADTMAGIADPLFAAWARLSPETAWLAVIAYAFQIYFDFSGYSNMAIGLAFLTGFDFPLNFNYPYISQSITEFWRRWHITLSSWFRDYLYIPLGGNRHGPLRTYCNLVIVFLLCGLWHGAAWTFVLWGIYHGVLLVLERVGLGPMLQRMPAFLRHMYALLAIGIGWVLFRAENLPQASAIVGTMFGLTSGGSTSIEEFVTVEGALILISAAALSTPLVPAVLKRWVAVPAQRPWPEKQSLSAYVLGIAISLAIFFFSAVKILTGSYSPFIYFRF
jgi:alginate O-acetyltransferase complex protein AlgI